jgi:hypothetical protein
MRITELLNQQIKLSGRQSTRDRYLKMRDGLQKVISDGLDEDGLVQDAYWVITSVIDEITQLGFPAQGCSQNRNQHEME